MSKSRWLVKSEPTVYAFETLQKDGRTTWDGVRNNTAAMHLRAMRLGDEVFFYHSQEGKAVVGIASVAKEAFPDATDPKGRFVAVELAPVRPLKAPVTLAAMKANPKLAQMKMLTLFRTSVSPLTEDEWAEILRMAGE